MKKEELENKLKKLIAFKFEIQKKEEKLITKQKQFRDIRKEVGSLAQDIGKMKRQLIDEI